MMKCFQLIAILFLLAIAIGKVQAQSAKSLTALKPVSGGFDIADTKVSIAGQIFDAALLQRFPFPTEYYFAVYDLGGVYSRFEAWIGIPDGGSAYQQQFQIKIDGKIVAGNKDDLISPGDKPAHIVLDTTGAHSLKIVIEGGLLIANPVLYKADATSFNTIASSGTANLVSPKNGAKATAGSITLLWEPVDGATSYGVEIVCTKGTSPHIYSMNATDSTAKFDLMGVPNGEYHWSVISFNDKGVMGKFSKDRTFIVAR